jgi:O-antigen/teichoic acid export membrane protein
MGLRNSILISFGKSGGNFAIQFVSNVVLARLLLPSEIGIFSVAVAVMAIVHALRDFGVSAYIIKEADLTDDKVRTVFGVALLIGFSLAAAIFLGRGAIADYYSEPQISEILAIMSINFLLLPFGQPALVLMRREKRFSRLAVITLITAFFGVSVSILLAALGFGPFALAYGALASNGLMVVLTLYSRPDHILMLPSLKEWRSVCGFGGMVSVTTIITNLGMQAPELLIGRFLGFSEVGLFSRAFGLAKIVEQLFVNTVNWITSAEFAARLRSGEKLTGLVLKVTDYTLVICWPAMVFLALKAEAIIWLLFGENWLPAVPLIQALCIARGLHLVVSQAGAIYEGSGAIGLLMRNETILVVVSVGLLIIGIQHSLEAVAWMRVPFGIAVILVHFSVMRRYAEIGTRQMISATWRSGLISMIFCVALVGLITLEPAGMESSPLLLLGEAVIMGLLYIILLFGFSHPLGRDLLALVEEKMPGALKFRRLVRNE